MQTIFPEIKEMLYEKESKLAPWAKKSYETKGRKVYEEPCPFRTDFERDRDRIIHSKAFRRLKRKTQVFFAPSNDHIRTRLTHTLEVSQIARTLSRILNLNEYLTEAIALGHDLGHTPFGHTGEKALNNASSKGFHHHIHSVRVVEVLENLNLCEETIDGILCHSSDGIAKTLEGRIVKISDKVAYVSHDVEDAIREKVMEYDNIPLEYREYFGDSKDSFLTKIISDIYKNSCNKPEVSMSEECNKKFLGLKTWMFNNVYLSEKTKTDEEEIINKVTKLFNYYKNLKCEQIAIDYVAGMSDEYALNEYKKIFKE